MKTNKNQINVTAAYSTALKNARTGGAKLTQEKAGIIANATVTALHTDEGKPITLTQPQKDTIKALFYPTRSLRISVLTEALKGAGCTLDDTTLELLTPLLSPANFDKQLKERAKAVPKVDWSQIAGEEEEESTETPEEQEQTPAPAAAPKKAGTKGATAGETNQD